MLGPFATASRYIAIHQVSLLSHAACASMSITTTTTTTTTTRDSGDHYGPIEWAHLGSLPGRPRSLAGPTRTCRRRSCDKIITPGWPQSPTISVASRKLAGSTRRFFHPGATGTKFKRFNFFSMARSDGRGYSRMASRLLYGADGIIQDGAGPAIRDHQAWHPGMCEGHKYK